MQPSSSILVSVTSNSSNNWHFPINQKASVLTKLQDSILREVSREHEFVMSYMDACVILPQHVISNFSSSFCVCTRKEILSSVTAAHLLKFSSFSEAHELPMAFNPELVPIQPSSLTNCSLEKLCRHFVRSIVTWIHQKLVSCMKWLPQKWLERFKLTAKLYDRISFSKFWAPFIREAKPIWLMFWHFDKLSICKERGENMSVLMLLIWLYQTGQVKKSH